MMKTNNLEDQDVLIKAPISNLSPQRPGLSLAPCLKSVEFSPRAPSADADMSPMPGARHSLIFNSRGLRAEDE